MRHLSGVDASFLHLETPEMPMHVGSLNIFDLPEGYTGDFYEDVKAHIAGRMHLAEVFEHKLAQIPFELSNPVWVDDSDIDIDYHIRRVVLSKPGTFKQLEQLVGAFALEPARPQPAAVGVLRHRGPADGPAGDLCQGASCRRRRPGRRGACQGIYDLTPEPRPVKAPRARNKGNQYQLGVAELATAAVQNTIQQYVQALHHAAERPAGDRERHDAGVRGWQFTQFGMPKNWQLGPKTPLNVSITNQRSFAARSVSLAEVKQIAKACGGTVNDIVLAASASALRRYPDEYNQLPSTSLNAAVPVSLREAGTYGPQQPSVDDAGEPRHRHRRPARASEDDHRLEQGGEGAVGQPQGGDPDGFPLLRGALDHGGVRAAVRPLAHFRQPAAGRQRRHLQRAGGAGAAVHGRRQARHVLPGIDPGHGVALNITVQSYNGSLDYGLTACRRAVPDVDDLIEYLVEAHRELRHLVLGPQAAAAKPLEKAEQTATRVAAEKMPAQVAAEPAKRSHAAKGKAARPVNGKAAAASDTAAAPAKARRSPKKTAPKAPSPAKRKAKTKAAEPVAEEAAPPDKALN